MNATIEGFMQENGAAIDYANQIAISERGIMLSVALKRRELAAMMLSAGEQDIRYYINGLCFEVDESGKIKLISTDGHRITVMQIAQVTDTGERQIIVPRDAIDRLKMPKKYSKAKANDDLIVFNFAITPECARIVDGVKVTVPESVKIEIVDGSITLNAHKVDGKFPDYRRVLPLDFTVSTASINADYLHDAQIAAQLINNTVWGGALYQNGKSCSVYWVNSDCIIGIMAMRTAADDQERFIHSWS